MKIVAPSKVDHIKSVGKLLPSFNCEKIMELSSVRTGYFPGDGAAGSTRSRGGETEQNVRHRARERNPKAFLIL